MHSEAVQLQLVLVYMGAGRARSHARLIARVARKPLNFDLDSHHSESGICILSPRKGMYNPNCGLGVGGVLMIK